MSANENSIKKIIPIHTDQGRYLVNHLHTYINNNRTKTDTCGTPVFQSKYI